MRPRPPRRRLTTTSLDKLHAIGAPLIGAALLMAALAFLVLGLRRRWRRAVPWYAAAVVSLALMIVAVSAYRTALRRSAGRRRSGGLGG